MLVYDITERQTFASIKNWVSQILTHAESSVNKILIGNKCDLPNRDVQLNEGEAVAAEYGMKMFECSAKTNVGVESAFLCLTKDVKARLEAGGNGRTKAETVSVSPDNSHKSSKGCC